MAIVLNDTFTGSADDPLLGRTPDVTGAEWIDIDISGWYGGLSGSDGPKLDGSGKLEFNTNRQVLTPDQVIGDTFVASFDMHISDGSQRWTYKEIVDVVNRVEVATADDYGTLRAEIAEVGVTLEDDASNYTLTVECWYYIVIDGDEDWDPPSSISVVVATGVLPAPSTFDFNVELEYTPTEIILRANSSEASSRHTRHLPPLPTPAAGNAAIFFNNAVNLGAAYGYIFLDAITIDEIDAEPEIEFDSDIGFTSTVTIDAAIDAAGDLLLDDRMIDADGTTLQAHPPTFGTGTWIKRDGETLELAGNELPIITPFSFSTYEYSEPAQTSEVLGVDTYSYLFSYTAVDTGDYSGGNLTLRVQVDGDTSYDINLGFEPGNASVFRSIDGLGDYLYNFIDSGTHPLGDHDIIVRVGIDAGAVRIRAYVDNVLWVDVTDSDTERISTLGGISWTASEPFDGTMVVRRVAMYEGFAPSAPGFDVEISFDSNIGFTLAATIESVTRVGQEFVLLSGYRVGAEIVIDDRYLTEVKQEIVLTSDIRDTVKQEFALDSTILDYDVLKQEWSIVYPLLDGVPTQISTAPTITIRGQVIPFDTGSVAFDEGKYAWTCQLTLFNPLHYALFHKDDTFTVNLPGEDYAFIVDAKSFTRAGLVDLSATISGISPSANYAAPRAAKINRTWDTAVLVTAVVEELFGTDVVDWLILNWSIPAHRLGAVNQTPIEILQRLADAAGAVIDCEPDGSLSVQYRYPVSVLQYDTATPDQEYFDDAHNFKVDEQMAPAQIANKLRILDVEPGANRDTIEFEQDKVDFARGVLRVFPQPWRETITVEHTSNDQVSAALVGIETAEHTETVEIIGGKGSVSKPIYEIVSLEWLFDNLTGVAFEQDTNEFTTTHPTLKESLLVITYNTRFIKFDAAAFVDAEVQFLVREVT